jgi:hypothetical protein
VFQFHPSVVRSRADLGEFFIRFVIACIDFVLINIGFSTSLINQGFRVWLKVNVLLGSCLGNTAGRRVVFKFRISTQLIIGLSLSRPRFGI